MLELNNKKLSLTISSLPTSPLLTVWTLWALEFEISYQIDVYYPLAISLLIT